MTVLIAGGSDMARAYAKVLKALNIDAEAFCQSEKTAAAFHEETGFACVAGGVAGWAASGAGTPEAAIIAVPVDKLAGVSADLIARGVKRLLVEKPAGLDAAEVASLADTAAHSGAEVFVAYNRRFYGSVRRLRDLAREDGGIVSFTFEFTELSDRVGALETPAEVLARWGTANSTHVIDTAFFLGGMPADISGTRTGGFAWHPSAARFAGHGVTQGGALFSYIADWDAPGRWGIEMNTRMRKFVLRPMETLQVQARNTFSLQQVEPEDDFDQRFKPGLFRQTRAFLTGEDAGDLLSIADHAERLALIERDILNARKV